jgi:hypothetical protein
MLGRRAFNTALLAAAAMPVLPFAGAVQAADEPPARVSVYSFAPVPRETTATSNWKLECHNQRMIQNLKYSVYYWGNIFQKHVYTDWMNNINDSIAPAMKDQKLNMVFSQYIKSSLPSGNSVDSDLLETKVLADVGDWTPRVTPKAIKERLKQLIRDGGQGVPSDIGGFKNFAAVFVLPPGTVMVAPKTDPKEPALTSLDGLGAYHTWMRMSTGTQNYRVYFAVVAWSDGQNGTANPAPNWDPWKNVSVAMYHELAEIRTDPDIGVRNMEGWYTDLVNYPHRAIADLVIAYYDQFPQDAMYEYEMSVGGQTVKAPLQYLWANSIPGPYKADGNVSETPAACTPTALASEPKPNSPR